MSEQVYRWIHIETLHNYLEWIGQVFQANGECPESDSFKIFLFYMGEDNFNV